MSSFATYAFDGDTVVAFDGDHVIAKGNDFEKVSTTAEEYFNELRNAKKVKEAHEARASATHITTPNGETGVILGRTASVFSDSITVRFENGQIRHYDTFVGDGLQFTSKEVNAPSSPVEYFQRQLDETYTPSRDGLISRLNTLSEVRKGATYLASQRVSYADGQELHKIVLTADAEANEVKEALEHLVAADAEAMVPPKQSYTAVEQASMGNSGDWLEVVAKEIIAESEAEDYDKLLSEGPTNFVSNLETGTLAHTGTVAEMAREHITSRTAGFQGEAVDDYRDRFVASTELARRRELTYRQDAARDDASVKKSAVAEAPDEALFL